MCLGVFLVGCFFFLRLYPQEIEKASPTLTQEFDKARTFCQGVLSLAKSVALQCIKCFVLAFCLVGWFSFGFLFGFLNSLLFQGIISKQRCNLIRLDCKHFIAVSNCKNYHKLRGKTAMLLLE